MNRLYEFIATNASTPCTVNLFNAIVPSNTRTMQAKICCNFSLKQKSANSIASSLHYVFKKHRLNAAVDVNLFRPIALFRVNGVQESSV